MQILLSVFLRALGPIRAWRKIFFRYRNNLQFNFFSFYNRTIKPIIIKINFNYINLEKSSLFYGSIALVDEVLCHLGGSVLAGQEQRGTPIQRLAAISESLKHLDFFSFYVIIIIFVFVLFLIRKYITPFRVK